MSIITVGQENGHDIEIYYEDHGMGHPVILIHGYPLDGRAFEKQERALLDQGYRTINYDRRGFGMSSKTTVGYDYDTFAADLKVLIEHLDLHDVTLVGHSMGTGEVVRYIRNYGSGRVAKAVLISSLPPYLAKADDNPLGVDPANFEGVKAAILADRPAYMKAFCDDFSNVDTIDRKRISEPAWQAGFTMALAMSAFGAYACVDSWSTDFREDLTKLDVPVLVIHGEADRVLPFDATAGRLPGLIADLTLLPVEGAPHNVPWTHAEVVNPALLDFLKR